MKLHDEIIDRIIYRMEINKPVDEFQSQETIKIYWEELKKSQSFPIYGKQLLAVELKVLWAPLLEGEVVVLIQSGEGLPLAFDVTKETKDASIWGGDLKEQWIPLDTLTLAKALVGAETLYQTGGVWQPFRPEGKLLERFKSIV